MLSDDVRAQLAFSGSSLHEAGASSDDAIPYSIQATTEDVERWMQDFRPLTNVSTNDPPECGDSVLWRGVKCGPSGGQSTKLEWFNGTVHAVEAIKGEVYAYVD